MKQELLHAAAGRLNRGRLHGEPLTPLPARLRPADEAAAYLLQREMHARFADAGRGALAGYKIGCTSKVMQDYLHIDHPCAGGVLAPSVHHRTATLQRSQFHRPGVECEIAVRLAAALPPRDAPWTAADVAPAVGQVMAAIEIVDDRWQDYTEVDAFTLIADDFFGAGCVLGEPVDFDPQADLPGLRGEMTVNGRSVGTGAGRDILGHPLNALAWLAGSGAAADGLLEGQVVLLGSVVKTHWIDAGDTVEVSIRGLGDAALTLG